MHNPWELTRSRHFNVHPEDERRVSQHNRAAKVNKQIERGLPPLPFMGDARTARVILLAKNAAYYPEEETDAEAHPEIVDENLNALRFESEYPLFYLDPRFEGTTGFAWWSGALKDIITFAVERSEGALTPADVAGRIAILQSHPYRTRESFDSKPGEEFPTQAYTEHLVAEAVTRPGVVFIVMGGKTTENRWRDTVPTIPANTVRLRNIQKPWPTKSNMSEADFERTIAALIK